MNSYGTAVLTVSTFLLVGYQSVFATDEIASLNVASAKFRRTHYAMSEGGAIYVGRVIKRTPSPVSDDQIERGRVVIEVSRTLIGPEKKSLDLAYALRPRSRMLLAYSSFLPIWSDAEVQQGISIICLVVPNGYNGAAEPTPTPRNASILPNDYDKDGKPVWQDKAVLPNPDGAASRVQIVSGPQDTVISEYEEIVRLFKFRSTPHERSALVEAANDGRVEVMHYVADAIVETIGSKDPTEAIRMLRLMLDRATEEKQRGHSWELGTTGRR